MNEIPIEAVIITISIAIPLFIFIFFGEDIIDMLKWPFEHKKRKSLKEAHAKLESEYHHKNKMCFDKLYAEAYRKLDKQFPGWKESDNI